MDFLKEVNISEETIDYLNSNINEQELNSIYLYVEDIESAIKYFQEIGVTVVENLLKYDFHIFMPGRETLERAISKLDKQSFVSALNQDIRYIKILEKNEYV